MPPRFLSPVPQEDLRAIWNYLDAHSYGKAPYPLAKNYYRKKVGEGVSQCFGIVGKRWLPPDFSRQSWLHPELHHLLMKFAEKHVPVPFTSIQVNCNFPCNPHKDVGNLGESYIVGFGSYRGGSLCVENADYNISYRGLLFDGSQLTHWTKPWVGDRYSLVFHTIAPKERFGGIVPSLENFEAIYDEEWKIRRKSDGRVITRKDPLPWYGRKKLIPTHIPYPPCPSPEPSAVEEAPFPLPSHI